MTKKPTPEMDHEYDASLKATRVYVWLEGHSYRTELRFFDDGRFEIIYATEEEIVADVSNVITDAIERTARRLGW